MELYWLRHGIAEDKQPGRSDAERHLTQEGIQEVRFVAKYLSNLDLDLDLIASSPLVRAVETAEVAADVLGVANKVLTCDGLLPEDNWETLRKALKAFLPFRKIMLVGHEPSFGQMIGQVLSPGGNLEIPLKKAGVCRTELEELSQRPHGELVWLLNPKLLRKMSKV